MEIPFDDVTRYGLVNSDLYVTPPRNSAYNTLLQNAKVLANHYLSRYNSTRPHEGLYDVRNALWSVFSIRGNTFFETVDYWSNYMLAPNVQTLPRWDGKETVVTHMAFDVQFPADGSFANPQMLPGLSTPTPVYYLVRDFDNGPPINLPRSYLMSAHNRAEGARYIREVLANVWQTQGQFLFTAQRGNLEAQAHKQYFDQKIAELVRVVSEANYAGRLCVDFKYETDYADRFVFPFTGGTMTMEIQQGVPILSGLTEFNYPENVQKVINDTLREHGTGTNVLFVKLDVLFTADGLAVQHYLLLSEYDKECLPMLMARGMESDWDNTVQVETYSIRAMEMNDGRGIVRCPFPEGQMINAMMAGLNTSLYEEKGLAMDNSAGQAASLNQTYQEFIQHLRLQGNLNTEGAPVRHFFFSADGLCVQLTFYDLFYEANRTMLRLNAPVRPREGHVPLRRIPREGNYCVVTIVQYPFLFYGVERRWNRSRRASRSVVRARRHLPSDFQAPGVNPLYNDLRYLDTLNRETYPLREIIAMPPGATYAAMIRRNNTFPEQPKSFYVNNIEPDPTVVYVTDFWDVVGWNSMARFRIEAEARVSQFMFDLELPIFYEFRRRMPPFTLYPFKAYLLTFDVAREEWSRIWREEYEDMERFARIVQEDDGMHWRHRADEDGFIDWDNLWADDDGGGNGGGHDVIDWNNFDIDDDHRRDWRPPVHGGSRLEKRPTQQEARPADVLPDCRRSGLAEARGENEAFLLRRLGGLIEA